MATILQTGANNNASPGSVFSTNKAYGSTVTAGSLLVCMLSSYNTGATLGVSDNVNGTWNPAVTGTNANATGALFYFPNAAAGTTTVTCTSNFGVPMRLALEEWGGGLLALDQTGSALVTAVTTASVSTSGSTVQANELIITGITGASGTPAINANGASTLDFQTVGRLGLEYWNGVNAPGIQTPSFTYAVADNGIVLVATFQSAIVANVDTLLGQGWV